MNKLLPAIVSAMFAILGLWHFYMALTHTSNESGAVPNADGKPLFVPSKLMTFAVGVVLLLFAALVVATAGMLSFGLPRLLLVSLSYALALGLVLCLKRNWHWHFATAFGMFIGIQS